MTRDDVIAAARAQIGTPFAHQGRTPGKGMDCAGLIIQVARMLGIDHIDVPAYGRLPQNGLLQETLDIQPSLVRVTGEPQPGDILLMRFGSDPQHLAIYAGETIIHSYANAGKVCEHRLADVWKARIVSIWRFAEIES